MSAKQGGSFATLLLAIPLSAIPLMAIFGVPEFSDVSAATEGAADDVVRAATTSFDQVDSTKPQARGNISTADFQTSWTADTTEPQPQASVPPQRSGGNASHPPSESPQQVPSPRPMQTAAVESTTSQESPTRPVASPAQTANGMTWREAARRLEEVGITDYRLERGAHADEFLFVCRFSPGGDSRIVQRFEAEAIEPLTAVEDVLVQVDEWLEHRYADSRRWLP